MTFDDDLPIFLADFGVNATAGGITRKVLFNKPDATMFEDAQVTGDYQIRYLKSEFPDLHHGTAIEVDGASYHIKGEPMALGDGRFMQAGIKK